jgi:2-methylcitrate dehydratase PrpD
MAEYYSEKLAAYVVSQTYDRLPAKVIEHAKWCLLDAIGVAVAGAGKKWAQAVLAEARRQGGKAEATIWLHGDKVPDTSAALVNGMFAHSMDFNDDHAGIQAGGIMPTTALAVAESVRATAKEVIAAIVCGYDVAIRVADAINSQQLYMRGFQPTAVCGGFAAAALAGKIMKLNPGQIADALGIVASYAGGTIEFLKDGTDTKRYHVAKAAHGGALSAHLAQAGMNGPRSIFEGEFGLFKVYSAEARPERLLAELGERYDILDTSVKLYPFCDGNAAPLEATLALMRDNDIRLDDIEQLRYRVKSFLIPYVIDYHGDRTRKFRPQNELDAQMSLPYCIAVGLLNGGDLRVRDFDPAKYQDPAILAIADKVDAEADTELDKVPLRPMSMPAIAELTTKAGKKFTQRVDYQKGDPRNPFSPQDFVAKFHACVDGRLSPVQANRIVDAVQTFERFDDIGKFTALLAE